MAERLQSILRSRSHEISRLTSDYRLVGVGRQQVSEEHIANQSTAGPSHAQPQNVPGHQLHFIPPLYSAVDSHFSGSITRNIHAI